MVPERHDGVELPSRTQQGVDAMTVTIDQSQMGQPSPSDTRPSGSSRVRHARLVWQAVLVAIIVLLPVGGCTFGQEHDTMMPVYNSYETAALPLSYVGVVGILAGPPRSALPRFLGRV
jgi:hypothetical protein